VKGYPFLHLSRSLAFGASLFAPPFSNYVNVVFGRLSPVASIYETVFIVPKVNFPQSFIILSNSGKSLGGLF